MEQGWKLVYFTGEEYRALIAKEVLADNGIEAVIINHRDSSYTSFGDLEMYVREDEYDLAASILQLLKTGEN
jgi:hypothetical protein